MNLTGKGYFQRKLTENQILIGVESYIQGNSLTSISKQIGCSRNTVKNFLIEKNLFETTSIHHSARLNYFNDINYQEKAYWLGVLAADGCVQISKKGYNVSLTLKRSDRDHVVKFQTALGATHPVYDHISTCKGKQYLVSSISIWSKQMVCDLIELGISPRKSLTLKFPNLKKELIRHFIRGYFDGDGSWYLQKNKYPAFSLIGSTSFIEKTQSTMATNCNLPFNKLTQTKTPGLIKLNYTGGRQCKRIFPYLYEDSSIHLMRKYEKVKHFFSE